MIREEALDWFEESKVDLIRAERAFKMMITVCHVTCLNKLLKNFKGLFYRDFSKNLLTHMTDNVV